MYGWRARLGIMVPSVNTVMEPELSHMAPEGVSVHAARLLAAGAFGPDSLIAMAAYTEKAAEELGHTVDAIAYGCTSGSFVKGAGWDEELVARIERVTQKPATTTSTAVVRALRALGLRTIAVATPYTREVNDCLADFFQQQDFGVLTVRGLEVTARGGQGVFFPSTAYRLAKEVDDPKADGILISCTNFRTIEIIELLEADLGKPVVTSNQATFWELLRLTRVSAEVPGYGLLLRQERYPTPAPVHV